VRGTILIVEDEESLREGLQDHLEGRFGSVLAAPDLATAREHAAATVLDGVILDLHLPDGSGFELLRELRSSELDVPVVVMTAFPDLDKAVTAMRGGACEFLRKPFDLGDLDRALDDAVLRRVGLETLPICQPECSSKSDRCDGLGRLVGRSDAMVQVREEVRQAAAAPGATVLITGDSGTGKELVAESLHFESARCRNRFVAINCAGIAPGVLESELFGHTAGSFTGAGRARKGLFEEADGGTLFLDEVGELPLDAQPKLLRVLETRRVRPVGGNTERDVDVRLVTATNRDLEAQVRAGEFREDLYWRLAVLRVHLPPLRERLDDIEPLSQAILVQIARRLGRPLRWIDQRAIDRLREHTWPGNVRELRNVLERAAVKTAGTTLQLGDLPDRLSLTSPALAPLADPPPETLRDAELQHIARVFRECDGNKSEAARRLGITRVTLRSRLKELGLLVSD